MTSRATSRRGPSPGAGRPAKPRTVLSTDIILAAAMELATNSTEALSLSRLGAALDANPTAVYRHFHSRDELLRAMADAVHQQIDAELSALPDDQPWRESLRQQAVTVRRCFLRYPALAREYCHRVTGGVHEARGIRRFAGRLSREGVPPEEAVALTRAMAELMFGSLSAITGVLTLPAAQQQEELYRLERVFQPAPLDPEPAADLPGDLLADQERTFNLALDLMLDGVQARIGARDRTDPPARA